MKYERTGPFKSKDDFEKLIEEAVSEAEDSEAEEFLSQDTDDAVISEELDRRILGLIEKRSAKEAFQEKYYPRILSSAALVTFVSVCFIWIAMMSTFVKFPWNDTAIPPAVPTDTGASVSGSFSEQTYVPQGQESTVITRPPETLPSAGNPGNPKESTNRGQQQGAVDPNTAQRDPANGIYTAPSDEKNATYIITQGDVNGVFVKISIDGYQSESIGKEFYVKSNEYFTVDIEVRNISASPLYRIVYTDCDKSAVPHVHGDMLALTFEGHGLCSSSIGFSCGKQSKTEILQSGETYRYQLRYAAGEEVAFDFDLPGDGTDYPAGVKLYNKTFYNFYTRGSCKFQGSFELAYAKNENGKTVKFAIPLTLDVLYVLPEK